MTGLAPKANFDLRSCDVADVPIVLQKSPSGLCEIEICNYRIGAAVLLNRCCAFQPDLESIFLAEMLKILLQHNLPKAVIRKRPGLPRHPPGAIRPISGAQGS